MSTFIYLFKYYSANKFEWLISEFRMRVMRLKILPLISNDFNIFEILVIVYIHFVDSLSRQVIFNTSNDHHPP